MIVRSAFLFCIFHKLIVCFKNEEGGGLLMPAPTLNSSQFQTIWGGGGAFDARANFK